MDIKSTVYRQTDRQTEGQTERDEQLETRLLLYIAIRIFAPRGRSLLRACPMGNGCSVGWVFSEEVCSMIFDGGIYAVVRTTGTALLDNNEATAKSTSQDGGMAVNFC